MLELDGNGATPDRISHAYQPKAEKPPERMPVIAPSARRPKIQALFLRPVAPQTSLSVERLYELLGKIEERNERMGAPEAGAG